MQEIRRKNHALTRGSLHVFDLLSLAGFEAGHWEVPFGERYALVHGLHNWLYSFLIGIPEDWFVKFALLAGSKAWPWPSARPASSA